MPNGINNHHVVTVALLVPLVIVSVLWMNCDHAVTLTSTICAYGLLLLPWGEFCRWSQLKSKTEFPLFPLIAGMCAVAYVIPLYLGDMSMSTYLGPRYFGPEPLERAMLLALLGVCFLWLGMRFDCGKHFRIPTRFEVKDSPGRWACLRIGLGAGAVLSLVNQYALGEGGRQMIAIMQTFIPTIAFVLLFRRYLEHKAEFIDKLLLIGFVSARFVIGMASGWLGSFAGFLVVVCAVYVYERHKFPITVILLALMVVMFFQPGKESFRRTFWREQRQAGIFERVNYWIDSSARAWKDKLAGRTDTKIGSEVVARVSLLEQTANVLQLTPDVVPYQHGKLYSYLVVGFVPRFLWPEKPTFNEANQWYQIHYGVTDEEGLDTVSIAVGVIAESYINFGWIGPILIMYALGLLLAFLRTLLLRIDAGQFSNALGIAIVPHLLAIESQMVQYIAGLLQIMLVALIVFSPVIAREHRLGSKMQSAAAGKLR